MNTADFQPMMDKFSRFDPSECWLFYDKPLAFDFMVGDEHWGAWHLCGHEVSGATWLAFRLTEQGLVDLAEGRTPVLDAIRTSDCLAFIVVEGERPVSACRIRAIRPLLDFLPGEGVTL